MRLSLCLLFVAALAWAADVTGKWTGEFAGPDGGGMQITFDLKQEGTKLTGTVTGPGGNMPIEDGKIDGDKITFTVTFDGGGGGMKILHEGKVNGNEIILEIKMGDQPGPAPMKLKRAAQ